MITLSDVTRALEEHPKDWNVGDVMQDKTRSEVVCINKNASLAEAIAIRVRRDVSSLPVAEPDEDGQPILVGWF